jgi:sulfur carrier protein ThiS
MSDTIRVLFINNDGGGFADHIDIPVVTTVEQLFRSKIKGGCSGDYLIRVNRQPVPADQILRDGDRVTITPTKVEGAARVLFINNDGGGFAGYKDIADGTTVRAFFESEFEDCDPRDYLIRVNRQPVPADQILRDGDRATVTPNKVEGAAI